MYINLRNTWPIQDTKCGRMQKLKLKIQIENTAVTDGDVKRHEDMESEVVHMCTFRLGSIPAKFGAVMKKIISFYCGKEEGASVLIFRT